MNKVILTGNLGKDPEIKALASGTKVAEFSLAVNEVRKGEKNTIWIPCKFYGKVAETMEKWVKKGSKIAIVGKWAIDTWEQDGQNRLKSYVFGETFEFIGSPQNQGSNQQSESIPPMEDDLPF